MRDHSNLIAELGVWAADMRPHPASVLMNRAADALFSQTSLIAEIESRSDSYVEENGILAELLSEAREEIERLKGLVAGIRATPQEPSRKERAGALEELRRLRDNASFGELWGGNGSRYLLGDRSDEDSSKHIVVARRPVCRDGDAQRWQHDATFIAACVTYVLDRIEPVHIRDVEGRIRRFFQENVGATRVECAAALRIDRRTVWKHLKRMREAANA